MSISYQQRQALVDNLYWFYQHGSLFDYVQSRPFPLRSKAEIEALFAAGQTVDGYDCSGSSIEACYISGLKDPSGYGFQGDGNTSSILAFLSDHYTNPAKALPGAFIIFGADLPLADQHVAIVGDEDSGTKNPIIFSHGAPGFKRLTLEEEQTAHSGATVFCSPAPLG